jgi:hypothetical protein
MTKRVRAFMETWVSLWRGPVTTKQQATRIIAGATWPLMALGLSTSTLLLSRRFNATTSMVVIVVSLLLVAPALLTLMTRNFLVSLFLFCEMVAFAVVNGAGWMALAVIMPVVAARAEAYALASSLIWAGLAFLGWRAMLATRAWSRLNDQVLGRRP